VALTTYNELKSAVSTWLHRSDMSPYLDDLITLGEQRIYDTVRSPEMEANFSAQIDVSTGVASTPQNYVELKFAHIDTQPLSPLTVTTLEGIYRQYPNRSDTGIPKLISRDAVGFVFGPQPASAYTIHGTYYVRLGALSSTINALFLNHPDLWLFGALSEAKALLGDDKRVALWEQKFSDAVRRVNAMAQRERVSGSSLEMRLA
jgi:hypothetical protein